MPPEHRKPLTRTGNPIYSMVRDEHPFNSGRYSAGPSRHRAAVAGRTNAAESVPAPIARDTSHGRVRSTASAGPLREPAWVVDLGGRWLSRGDR